MKVVAIALVLLQASLHSCRTYKAFPKNDTVTSKNVKLPSKLIQILESLDTPDAKITKIKELIPVYNDFPEFRVKSNKKHLFMPYKKKGKPLAYILKKTYVNKILSESSDSFEDLKNNERVYKGKPMSFSNKVYYPSSQNEMKSQKHDRHQYPKTPEDQIKVDNDVKGQTEINDYEQYIKNKPGIEKFSDVIDDIKEPFLVLPTEHKHVHHTQKHKYENSEQKAEAVSNSDKVFDKVTAGKHKESNHHHHHGLNPEESQLFQSEVKSDDTGSSREQIPQHQKFTDDTPNDSIPKAHEIEKELEPVQELNVHKHHHYHHSAKNTDNNSLNVVAIKHGHHKDNVDEKNVNHKHDLMHHQIVAHHTEDPHDLVNIEADELHSGKIDADVLKHNDDKSHLGLVVDTKAIDHKSSEKEHTHSHSHNTHHHSSRKENVKDIGKYLSYLKDLDLVSSKTNFENDLNLSSDLTTEGISNDTSSTLKEYNDNDAVNFDGSTHSVKNLTDALENSKFDTYNSGVSSEYYSDEFGLVKSTEASGSSEASSEFIDSFSDSNQESADENSSTVNSESENTSVFSNKIVINDSNSYSESTEFDSLSPASQSESSESNGSDISGSEELASEASNLISESVEHSSESYSTNLSDESFYSQSINNLESVGSQSSESSHSGSIGSSEIGLNSISGSDKSDSVSENDSKSDFSSNSGYLSQSESGESSQIDSPNANASVSDESIIKSTENQLNSTVILATTILNESNSITSSDSNSQESYTDSTPTDINLSSEESYYSSNANTSRLEPSPSGLEPSPSNLEIVLRSEIYLPDIESNGSSIENSAILETTTLSSSSAATEESTDSSLVTASVVESSIPDLESISSSLMSSASTLKSVASNLESSAISLKSVSGLEAIASKLNITAIELVYVALNLESTSISLNLGSEFQLTAPTESIARAGLTTESSVMSVSESKISNLMSLPGFESISQIIDKSPPSPPKFEAFYSNIKSSLNNSVHSKLKNDNCKGKSMIENNLSKGEKMYSMSFVFNK